MRDIVNYKCVIVIPIHNPQPTKYEIMSFEQCYRILGEHDIRVLAPTGLDVSEYRKINEFIKVIYIDPIWQADIQGYNRLKISSFFYSLFIQYEYLLTYELDAYVFKDELIEWCNKGYSYIGAPWFKDLSTGVPGNDFLGVGNSGFSLRNVSISYDCAKKIERFNRYIFVIKAFISFGYSIGRKKGFDKFLSKILKIKTTDRILYFNRGQYIGEDSYYITCFAGTFKHVKIADVSEALKFSFEVNPRHLYKMNNNKLPFGCHAYLKYDKEFWIPFFRQNDHSLG